MDEGVLLGRCGEDRIDLLVLAAHHIAQVGEVLRA